MSRTYTVSELAAALGLPARTIRWHCASPRGLMFGKVTAQTVPTGTVWSIPQEVAEQFARDYEPYKRQGQK